VLGLARDRHHDERAQAKEKEEERSPRERSLPASAVQLVWQHVGVEWYVIDAREREARGERCGHRDRWGRVLDDGDRRLRLRNDGGPGVLCARDGSSLNLLRVRALRCPQRGEIELGSRDACVRLALPRERRGESLLHRHSNQATDLFPNFFGPPFVCNGAHDLGGSRLRDRGR
jgi:hypothetical protein